MSDRRFRQALTVEERRSMCEIVRAWGYPRELDEREAEFSNFYWWGRNFILWFNCDGQLQENEMLVHVASQAGKVVLGKHELRRFLVGMGVLGEMAHADVLRYFPVEGSWLDRHMAFLGWKEDERGWYIDTADSGGQAWAMRNGF